jgi:hypothetical protein
MDIMQQILCGIRECESYCYKQADRIEMCSNTLRLLEHEARFKGYTLPNYKTPIPQNDLTKVFGLVVVINDNLRYKEFIIPIEETERKIIKGFMECYKRFYRFIID